MKPRDYLLLFVLIVLCCVSLYFLLPAYGKYRHTRRTVYELRADIERQGREIEKLRREMGALRTDYRAIERVAREKFRWCKEGEMIYRFAPPKRTDSLRSHTTETPQPASQP